MWQVVALTLFPEMFPGPLGESLAGKALKEGGSPGTATARWTTSRSAAAPAW